jgi:signal transduction histidine kinase/ligand-binding sensor domain-containing protein/DNA-binding response OmpR family regulator
MRHGVVCNLIFLFSIFFFSKINNVNAQQDKLKFISLNVKNGLSSNIVNDIVKDDLGYMWFATEDGLNRFDGQNFQVYRMKRNDPNSLQSNEISQVFKDRKGVLWVGTYGGGLSRYDQVKDRFNSTFNNNNDLALNNTINAITDDYLGNIWISSFERLHILDVKTNTLKRIRTENIIGHTVKPNFNVTSLFEDSKKRFWLGTTEGLVSYDRAKNKFTRVKVENDVKNVELSIRTISEDHLGNIWVGTDHGIIKVNHNSKNQDPNKVFLSKSMIYEIVKDKNFLWVGTEDGLYVINLNNEHIQYYGIDIRDRFSLSSKTVKSIFLDKEGLVWIGTYRGGINVYDKNLSLFNFKSIQPEGDYSLKSSIITSITEKDRDNIFISTDKNGIYLFNKQTNLISPISSFNQEHKGVSVLSILKSKSNQLWIGTFLKGLYVLDLKTNKLENVLRGENKNNENNSDVFSMMEDSENNIWLGTNGGGIKLYNQKEKRIYSSKEIFKDQKSQFNWYVRAIVEDKKGNIWISSLGSGLYKYNLKDKTLINYNKNNSNLKSNHIQTLYIDSKDDIWLGSIGDGFYFYNKSKENFENYSNEEGLHNAEVHKILEDNAGNMWLSTNSGISSFNKGTKKIKNYTHNNGLQNNNFVRESGLRASDGTLYFGGIEGFNYFNSSSIKQNNYLSPVVFTELKVNNKTINISQDSSNLQEHISIAKQIDLSYKQDFSIGFVALNYTNPQKNKYAYKLEGYDEEWNYVDQAKSASYTNLSPGNYVFKVKASNNDGLWNENEKSINIIVHPPFWLTPFAYVFYFLVVIGSLLFIRYLGIRKIKAKFLREQNILKAKELFEREKREVEQRHELDKLKLKFLTNLSHEFRTPISLIMAPVDKILSENEPVNLNVHVTTIKRNARRLLSLVNQLLDIRKIEEREFNLNLQKAEFVSFVKELVDSFKDLSERKNISLFFVSELNEFYTQFDANKIERILFNLLSNAFKFTPDGGFVKVELTATDNITILDDKKWLTIKVIDSGVGIPLEHHESIFSRFFQNEVNNSILNQGSGIGLSITKDFVELHGGSIGVKSEQGKGSTFIIEMPFTPFEEVDSFEESKIENTRLNEEQGVENSNTERPKILIVEDNDEFRYYLKENLKEKYSIIEASNGRDGWKEALFHHPELIVSDISMPFMSGIELTNKIKSDKRTNHTPVILLTAITGEEDILRGLETGANDYIAKPVNFDILNAKISNLLMSNKQLKEVYSKQINVLVPEVEISSESEKFLNKVVSFIEDNLTDTKLSVLHLSSHMNMSRSTLYYKILEVTGTTPIEFIRNIKLEKSLALLEKSDMNVSQISYCVGFASPNYFTKSFKSKYGMLPTEYTNLKRKKQQFTNEEIS